ncbi:MAG: thioredoxin family protein [Myxococcales bacterium]|nr:thioredoxin family protein [Myxococcales bacterium]
MRSVDDARVSLSSAKKEKGLLVIFTCNHCPYVKAWQGRTVPLANAALERGIGVIAINSNDPKDHDEDSFDGMKKRAEEQGMRYPYVVDEDSSMARAFGADKTPEFFLLNDRMELVYTGAIDDNAQAPDAVEKQFLKDALDALVDGRPIPVAQTKALGCSIKFRKTS